MKKHYYIIDENKAVRELVEYTRRDHFFIPGQGKGKFVRILIDEILFLESVGNYTKFHLQHGMHLAHASLKEMERTIDDDRLMRVHRCYVANMEKVVSVDGNMIQLSNNARIDLGPNYQRDFFAYILPAKNGRDFVEEEAEP